MPTYRRTRTVHAGEDRVFEYLADVHNLPRYVDRMTAAEPAGADTVEVTADVDGQTEHGEAWLRVDRTARRIQWGAHDDSGYSGTIDLSADQDRTIITIELHTEHTASDQIDQALDTTLDQIQHQLEHTPT
jgi:hypothetical protein